MKKVVGSLLLLLLSLSVSFGQSSPEFRVGESKADSRGSLPAPKARDGLLESIEQARQALRDESVRVLHGVVGARRVRVRRRVYKEVPVTGIVGREMALALLRREGTLQIVRGIKRDRGLDVLTPDIVLHVRRDNGINSDIACLKPRGARVVAVKYPVVNERGRFGPGPDVIEAVYTPYSPEIKTPETLKEGREAQDEMIQKAYARLKALHVFSRAFPGKKITEVIPKDVLAILLLNEHIDPSEFTGPHLAKPLVERVLTIIATNREKAYAYSISPAGARGLVQMIPSTYARLGRLYPSAGLMSNFAAGMSDATNAIVAQILLCDADWQTIRERSDVPAAQIGPYLAGAYNGGVGRVLTILANDHTEWMANPDSNPKPTKTVSRRVPVRVRTRRGMKTTYVLRRYTASIFRAETDKYIRQYHWIADYLDSDSGFRSTSGALK
jgi:hypothetical protein